MADVTKLDLEDRDETPRRRKSDYESEESPLRIRWSLVFQFLSYVIALFTVYNALSNRMTAVEIRGDSMRSDISEMKADIKTLLTRRP